MAVEELKPLESIWRSPKHFNGSNSLTFISQT